MTDSLEPKPRKRLVYISVCVSRPLEMHTLCIERARAVLRRPDYFWQRILSCKMYNHIQLRTDGACHRRYVTGPADSRKPIRSLCLCLTFLMIIP